MKVLVAKDMIIIFSKEENNFIRWNYEKNRLGRGLFIHKLREVLIRMKYGVSVNWRQNPVIGASRQRLAPHAKCSAWRHAP